MSGGNSDLRGGSNTEGGKSSNSMNPEKQNKHIPGTKEFDANKSPIDLVSREELDQLIKKNISNAVDLGNGKMILDLPKDIGTYISKNRNESCKTNRITIHKSKTGYHAVPAKPSDKKGQK